MEPSDEIAARLTAEIERRLTDFENGKMVSAPSEEVLSRIRKKHGLSFEDSGSVTMDQE